MGQEIVHSFDLAFGAAHRELAASAFDQVVEILLGVSQRAAISVFTFAADKQVRIEARFQGEHLDLKFLFDQQAEGAFGGLGASRVRIEIDHDVLG